jgi:hypothetical protein
MLCYFHSYIYTSIIFTSHHPLLSPSILLQVIFLNGIKVQYQGLDCARQLLCHYNHATSPFVHYFSKRALHFCLEPGLSYDPPIYHLLSIWDYRSELPCQIICIEGSSITFCVGCPQSVNFPIWHLTRLRTTIIPIIASWVDGITGMSNQDQLMSFVFYV